MKQGWRTSPLPPARFQTARLRMRALAATDAPLYIGLYTDAEVMRHVGRPEEVEAAAEAFGSVMRQMRAAPPRLRYWAVDACDGAGPIGMLAMLPGLEPGSVELGILLWPGSHGRGYATEAVAGLIGRIFARPGTACVHACHLDGHPAVPRVVARLGFVRGATREGKTHWHLGREAWLLRAAGEPFFATGTVWG